MLQPLTEHLPLLLLLATPVLILAGAALPPGRGRAWSIGALILLALGTGGLFLSAADPAAGSQSSAVFEAQASLASEVRDMFAGLLILYLGIVLLPLLLRRRSNRVFSTLLPLSFLILYSAGAVFLINTERQAQRTLQCRSGDREAACQGINGSNATGEQRPAAADP